MPNNTKCAARVPRQQHIPLVSIILVSLCGALFFIGSALRATHGVWTAPLDDTFIHFQYAKQIAHGNWFRYFPNAPVSTGDTSFLYPIILASGYRMGFTGLRLLWFAYAIGFACLAATGYLIFNIGLYFKLPRGYALWIALLTISNGWIVWGYFSGMEIALQSAFFLLMLICGHHETRKGRMWWFPWIASVLALVRPEGFIASALVALFIAYARRRRRAPIARVWTIALPFAAYAGELTWFHFATGAWQSNTFVAKTWWYALSANGPLHYAVLNKALKLAIVIFYFLPKAVASVSNDIGLICFIGLAVMLAGAVVARGAENAQTRISLAAAWIVIFTVEFFALLNIYDVTDVARRRYFIFLAPLAIFFMLYAVARAGMRYGRSVRLIVCGALTVLSFAHTLIYAHAYALDNQNIYEMHYRVAAWVERHTSPQNIIAMNDAGVVPYLTDRPFFDVMGLVTGGVARAVHEGSPAFLQYLTALKPQERPAYFIIFPGWFDSSDARNLTSMRALLKLFGAPVAEFTVSHQTIVPYGTMSVLQPRWQ